MKRILFIIAVLLISSAGYSQTKDARAKEYYDNGCYKVFKKNYSGAIADFTIAIEGNRNNTHYFNIRGQVEYYLQDYQGAISDFDIVIKSWSSEKKQKSTAFYWRGLAKIDLGQKDNGCLDLNKAGKLGYSDAYQAIKKYCK